MQLFPLLMLVRKEACNSYWLLIWACFRTKSEAETLGELILFAVLKGLHVSSADELDTLAVTAYNSWLAQFKSHGHDSHADNDEQRGEHEELGVIGYNITKTNGSEGDEAKVIGIKVFKISFPYRQNQAQKANVGKEDEKNEHKGDVQCFHFIS